MAPTRRRRLERVLTNDPGMGVMRHADAGYEVAVETAHARGVDLPCPRRANPDAGLRNIGQLAACRAEGGQGAIHLCAGAAVSWRGAVIRWVGKERDLPASEDDGVTLDAEGGLVIAGSSTATPTWPLAAGAPTNSRGESRARAIAQIAASGGGIQATVRKTRALSELELVDRCRPFLQEMVSLGVTCIEAKSGYGLDEETELAILRAYRALDAEGRCGWWAAIWARTWCRRGSSARLTCRWCSTG